MIDKIKRDVTKNDVDLITSENEQLVLKLKETQDELIKVQEKVGELEGIIEEQKKEIKAISWRAQHYENTVKRKEEIALTYIEPQIIETKETEPELDFSFIEEKLKR